MRDLHALYEAAVQDVKVDIDTVSAFFRRKRGRPMKLLREDFCGTASLSSHWAKRRPDNRAWGVDFHKPTLDWGLEHRVKPIGKAADRVTLVRSDVRTAKTPKVDMVLVLNFSCFVFKERKTMVEYMKSVRRSLRPDGAFVMDLFGGTDAGTEMTDKHRRPAITLADGLRVPAFNYHWEQAAFNPVTNEILCHIHFGLPDGTKIRKAFTYDWRLWSIPELREMLDEAGFESSDVYIDGWDDKTDESDGIYRRKKKFENQEGWIAYIAGWA